MASSLFQTLAASVILLIAMLAIAQQRYAGSAAVRVGGSEFTIPIECNDASRPELGFSTEPSRITRETTGRTSGVRLIVRPWKDTTYLVISLDRYVAWVPSQSSSGGILKMTLDMSPASSLVDGVPQALTYNRWMAGDRPSGLENVEFDANCNSRDKAAPAFRKIDRASR